MSLVVRPLHLGDAESAAHLHVETWLDTYRGLMLDANLDALDVKSFHRSWVARLTQVQQNNLQTFGAFLGDLLLGFAAAGGPRLHWGYDSELWAINIPRRFQKMGAGKALVRACVQHCLGFSARNMYFHCIIGNDNAMDFYHHLGALDTEHIIKGEGYQERAMVWNDLQALALKLG